MDTRTDGRRARSEASRAAILAGAVTIVARDGVAALTHRSVAAEAGVSPALVTYHFSTVAQLLQSALTFAAGRVGDALQALLPPPEDAGEVPAMAAELAGLLVTDLRSETLAVFGLMLAATREPDLRPALRGFSDRLVDLLQPLAGTRERALDASNALLGDVLANMALGTDDPQTLRVGIRRLIDHFDPRRGVRHVPDPH